MQKNRRMRIWNRMTLEMRKVTNEIDKIKKRTGYHNWPKDPDKRRRAHYMAQMAPWNEGGPVLDTAETCLDGPYGVLPLKMYRPLKMLRSGILLFTHGGGYVVGGWESHDRLIREMAVTTGSVVVAVNYHLAPEVRHPAAIDELSFVLAERTEWLETFQLDPQAVIHLVGDSCGAEISLATALRLRDGSPEDFEAIGALLLFCGGYGLTDSVSQRLWGGPWDGMSQRNLKKWEAAYLGDMDPQKAEEWNLLAADYDRPLCPAFLACAELDPLHDDSVLLYSLLKRENVVRFYQARGVLHTYMQYIGQLSEAQICLRAMGDFLKEVDKCIIC